MKPILPGTYTACVGVWKEGSYRHIAVKPTTPPRFEDLVVMCTFGDGNPWFFPVTDSNWLHGNDEYYRPCDENKLGDLVDPKIWKRVRLSKWGLALII